MAYFEKSSKKYRVLGYPKALKGAQTAKLLSSFTNIGKTLQLSEQRRKSHRKVFYPYWAQKEKNMSLKQTSTQMIFKSHFKNNLYINKLIS